MFYLYSSRNKNDFLIFNSLQYKLKPFCTPVGTKCVLCTTCCAIRRGLAISESQIELQDMTNTCNGK